MLGKEFSFELIAQDDKARLGKIYTPRGIIDTPAFMPVGTQGTIKGIFNHIISKRLDDKPDIFVENKLIETLSSILKNNKNINLSLLSEVLNIPTFSEMESELKNIDPLKLYQSIDELNYTFGLNLKSDLYTKLEEIEKNILEVTQTISNQFKKHIILN